MRKKQVQLIVSLTQLVIFVDRLTPIVDTPKKITPVQTIVTRNRNKSRIVGTKKIPNALVQPRKARFSSTSRNDLVTRTHPLRGESYTVLIRGGCC